jgi:hypothetical protein
VVFEREPWQMRATWYSSANRGKCVQRARVMCSARRVLSPLAPHRECLCGSRTRAHRRTSVRLSAAAVGHVLPTPLLAGVAAAAACVATAVGSELDALGRSVSNLAYELQTLAARTSERPAAKTEGEADNAAGGAAAA